MTAPNWARCVLRVCIAGSIVDRMFADVTVVPLMLRPLVSMPPKATEIWSLLVPKMPTWKETDDEAPARRFLPLKVASDETLIDLRQVLLNSTSRFAVSLGLIVPFWASTASWRMRVRSESTWSADPSAVCTILTASAAFC